MPALNRRSVGVGLAVVGVAAAAVGLALPWQRTEADFVSDTFPAFDFAGSWAVAGALVVSIVALVLYATRSGQTRRWSGLAVFIGGLVVAIVAIANGADIGSVEPIGETTTDVGEGLYLVIVAGIVQAVGMGVALTRGRRSSYGGRRRSA